MTSSPYRDFARLLTPGVRRAAAIARALEGRVPNVPKRGEVTRVKQALTEADTRAQEALLDALSEFFPAVALEAEEDTPGVARFPGTGDATVVIDPIDGTLHSYLEGSGPYAVMMGLVVAGTYEAGLVALPREGLLFGGTRGAGAWTVRPGGPPRPAVPRADGDKIFVSHGMPELVTRHLEREGLEVIPACGGAVAVAPLVVGVRAGLRYAKGETGVSIRGRIGALIAREAGAILEGPGQAPFPEDWSTPVATLRVATNKEDLALLHRALKTAALDGG